LKILHGDRRKIEGIVHQSIAVKYYQMNPEDAHSLELSGQSILIASHISDYIYQLLENDMKFAPFFLESIESEYSAEYQVRSGEQLIKIRVGGIIDRIDKTSEALRIIDYKTGRSLKLDFNEWSKLVDRDVADRRKEIFQTLIYSDILSRRENDSPILPAIYKLDNLFAADFVPNIIFQGKKLDFQDVKKEFTEIFSEVLSEMFSVGNVYDQVKDSRKCSYCPYNKICRR